MDTPDRLLTVEELAELCSLKRSSIYAAVSRNLIPAVVLWRGRRRRVVRFRRSDVERWLEDRTVPARND